MAEFATVINDFLREARSVFADSGAQPNVGSAMYQLEAASRDMLDMYKKILEYNKKLIQDLEREGRMRDHEYQLYRSEMTAMYSWIDRVAEVVGLSNDENPPTLEEILTRIKELAENSK